MFEILVKIKNIIADIKKINMEHLIKGFNPHTFIDWEGKIACVIYLSGCNLRCPFCHSSTLIFNSENIPTVPYKKIEEFFQEKRDWIDAVVLQGGEPMLYPHLKELLRDIKARNLLVKIDTNGTRPQMLQELINEKLIDYVAMDIKAPLTEEKYIQLTAATVDLLDIKQSINFLIDSKIDYEFRTTVIPGLLDKEDILKIAQSIQGAKKYVLQQFDPKDTLDSKMGLLKPYSKEMLEQIAELACKFVKNSLVRGI
ncbi:MAG: anaerobic ribonucleoside-triphosphate reductase activating protein [Candidatus Omnitrophota bacterium]